MRTPKELKNRAKWTYQSLDNSILASQEIAFNLLAGRELTTQEFIIASTFPREKAMSLLAALERDKRIERKNGKWYCK